MQEAQKLRVELSLLNTQMNKMRIALNDKAEELLLAKNAIVYRWPKDMKVEKIEEHMKRIVELLPAARRRARTSRRMNRALAALRADEPSVADAPTAPAKRARDGVEEEEA